jgi:hypothetical protein
MIEACPLEAEAAVGRFPGRVKGLIVFRSTFLLRRFINSNYRHEIIQLSYSIRWCAAFDSGGTIGGFCAFLFPQERWVGDLGFERLGFDVMFLPAFRGQRLTNAPELLE